MAAKRELPAPAESTQPTKRTKRDFALSDVVVEYDPAAVVRTLRQYGCVRVDGVFADEVCDSVVEGFAQFMEGLGTGFVRDMDWDEARDLLPPQTRHGLFQALTSNISELRTLQQSPRLRAIFEAAYGTDKLVVSADGINWAPPTTRGPRWDHLDQSRPGPVDLQCVVNLATTDAGTVVWPRSHTYFEELLKRIPKKKGFLMLRGDDLRTAQALARDTPGAAEGVVIPSVKGSVTIWLSSVIHAGAEPTTAWRAAAYVTYRPCIPDPSPFGRPFTKRERTSRARAARERRHTNHTAGKLVAKKPGDFRRYINSSLHPLILDYLDDPTTLPNLPPLPEPDTDLGRLYALGEYP